MRPLWFGLVAALLLRAQPAPERDRAREILDQSVELAGAASIEVHAIVMLHAGIGYKDLDKARSVELLRQAFTAAAALEGDRRDTLQSMAVRSLAAISLEDAVSLLRGMAEPAKAAPGGPPAADGVIGRLIEDKNYDRAMEVLALIPERAEYPHGAARDLFEKLPADDPRRTILFGRAAEAYKRRAEGAFPDLLARHWRDVPRSLAESSLGIVVNAMSALDEETRSGESYNTDQGVIKLGSRQAIEFFRVIAALRALDPKRCEEVLKAYPDLRAAVKRFPDGRLSADAHEVTQAKEGKSGGSWSTSASETDENDLEPLWSSIFAVVEQMAQAQSGPPPAGAIQKGLAAGKRAQQAIALAATEPMKALARAREVDSPGMRAETLGRIVEALAGKDEATARRALDEAEGLLQDVKPAMSATFGWMAVARARHKLKDEKPAWAALRRAEDGVLEFLRFDVNPERVNQAPRELWPSTMTGRLVARCAAELFRARAVELLDGVEDTSLALLQRLQTAETLLGVQSNQMTFLATFTSSN